MLRLYVIVATRDKHSDHSKRAQIIKRWHLNELSPEDRIEFRLFLCYFGIFAFTSRELTHFNVTDAAFWVDLGSLSADLDWCESAAVHGQCQSVPRLDRTWWIKSGGTGQLRMQELRRSGKSVGGGRSFLKALAIREPWRTVVEFTF